MLGPGSAGLFVFYRNNSVVSDPLNATSCHVAASVASHAQLSSTIFLASWFLCMLAVFLVGPCSERRYGALNGRKPAHLKRSARAEVLYLFTIGAAITVSVVVPSVLFNEVLKSMDVAQKAASAGVSCFIQPVLQLFLFFEDGITTKVGFLFGASRMRDIGTVAKLGTIGSFVVGLSGAAASAVLGSSDAVVRFFVARPGVGMPLDCPLFPDPEQVVAASRTYWWLLCGAVPFQLLQAAHTGVFLGAQEVKVWFAAVTSCSALLVCIYSAASLLPGRFTPLDTAGVMYYSTLAFFPVSFSTLFCTKRWTHTFHFSLFETDVSPEQMQVYYSTLGDGTALMVKDTLLTLQFVITYQLLGNFGIGVQNRLVQFLVLANDHGGFLSPAAAGIFVIVLGYVIRLAGSTLFGTGSIHYLAIVLRGLGLCALGFGTCSALSLLLSDFAPYYSLLNNGECMYATQQCSARLFEQLFFDIRPCLFVYAGMCFVSPLTLWIVSCLYALNDFCYIRNSVVCCFVLLYTPATCFAYWAGSPSGLLGALLLTMLGNFVVLYRRTWFVLMPLQKRSDTTAATAATVSSQSLVDPLIDPESYL